MKPRLPIALVTGFLGSGKTTFLRYLIADAAARGLKVGVVINEFGAAAIDSSILRSSGADLLGELAGGCACCSSQDEMIWTMLRLGGLPREEQPDVVLLEASGLADPLVMLDGLTVAVLLPLIRAATLISVVDAPRLREFCTDENRIAPLLKRQVALADLIVANKIDIAFDGEAFGGEAFGGEAFGGEKSARKAELEAILRAVNPSAQLEWARHGEIALDSWWARVLDVESALPAPGAGLASHGHAQTLVVPMPRSIGRDRLEVALQNLPPAVWRAKGFVRLAGENDLFLVQLSGAGRENGERQIEITRFEAPDWKSLPPSELVFIGPSLDLNALWRDFNGTAPELQA